MTSSLVSVVQCTKGENNLGHFSDEREIKKYAKFEVYILKLTAPSWKSGFECNPSFCTTTAYFRIDNRFNRFSEIGAQIDSSM